MRCAEGSAAIDFVGLKIFGHGAVQPGASVVLILPGALLIKQRQSAVKMGYLRKFLDPRRVYRESAVRHIQAEVAVGQIFPGARFLRVQILHDTAEMGDGVAILGVFIILHTQREGDPDFMVQGITASLLGLSTSLLLGL